MKLRNLQSNQQLDDFERTKLDQLAEEYLLQLVLGGTVQDVTISEEKKTQIVQYHESTCIHASHDQRKQQAIEFFHNLKGVGAIIDFRTFDDYKQRKDKTLTKKLRGTIEDCYDELSELNLRGAGVFFTVNTTDGHGVGNDNIVSIEYMWIEDDGDDPDAVAQCPLTPYIKVKSSVGHYHSYFKVEAGKIAVSEFNEYQAIMADKYGSDPNALDPSRVLRAVGFFHCKVDSIKELTGEMQLVEVLDHGKSDVINTATQLDDFLATGSGGNRTIQTLQSSGIPTNSDFYKASVKNMSDEERKRVIPELESALSFISSDDRSVWVKVGFSLYWLGDDGYRLWIEWSKTSPKFDQSDADDTWRSFHKTKTGYQVIFKMAADNGWINQVKGKSKVSSAITTEGAVVNSVTGELVNDVSWVDVNGNGTPLPTIDNTKLFLEASRISFYFDEMLKERIFKFPDVALSNHNRSNNSITQIKSLASKCGLSREATVENAMTLADNTLYHPAREWIESIEWDGVSRYNDLLNTLDPINRDMAYMLLRLWLISCIAALYEAKGVAAQGVLVLQGLQGCGKTTWLKKLCGIHPEFFRESLILNPSNKDSVKLAVTRWIAEFGELGATFRKSDLEEIKAFITRDEDELRLPYAAAESKWARRTVFCASVNDMEFLHDPTGNRRFWSIPVNDPQPFDMPDMQQVWAEVKSWYEEEESWVLSSEQLALLNDSNIKHTGVCPIEESIKSGFDWQCAERFIPMTTTQICHSIGIERPTKMDTRTVGKVIRELLNVSHPRKSNGSMVFDMPSRGNSPTG